MAGRNRAVLSKGSGAALSSRPARKKYNYLPWVDLICAGVPCQDVSVAGKRAGLKGQRTGLFYDFARILKELRPTWFVFENVPGLLSSNGGRDFAEVLRVLMVECGYGVSWRVLDSQFFGVAQRRRRVFIVGRFGKPCPAEVLFESEGCERDIAEGGEAGTDVAYALAAGSGGSKFGSGRDSQDTFVTASLTSNGDQHKGFRNGEGLVAHAISSSAGHHGHSSPRGDGSDNLVFHHADEQQHGLQSVRGEGNAADHGRRAVSRKPGRRRDSAATLNCGGNTGGFRTEPGEHIVIQDVRGHRDKKQNGIGIDEGGSSYTLDGTSQHAVAYSLRSNERNNSNGAAVNLAYCLREDPGGIGQGHNINFVSTPPDSNGMRSTPGIYEGLDDSDTFLPTGQDSARYRALGNAVTVSVARWIAERILESHPMTISQDARRDAIEEE